MHRPKYLKSYTLGSEINVGSGISVGVGRFGKKISIGSGIIVGVGKISFYIKA